MASIKFDIRGDNTNFLRSMQGAQKGVRDSINAIEKSTSGLTGTFNKMKDSAVGGFKQIALGLTGITALMESGSFLKGLISDMGEFTKAMKEVSTLSQDVSANFEQWKSKVVDVTTQIPIAATEAAKAMYQIESAGHHGADALNVLTESAKGAIGGVTDTFMVADAITTILNSYNMSAEEAAKVSDMLFTTVKLGKTNMQSLASTIAQVAPIASTFGVGIEEVLAAVATLTKSGTKTSVAMRQVRDSIVATTKALGDDAFKGRRFLDAMQEVADGANGSNLALRKELASLQALNGVLGMTGKNYKGAERDLEAMANSAGAADEAYQKMADTAGNSAILLKNNIFKALEPIGDTLIGFGKTLSNALNEGFETGGIDKMVEAVEALVLTYGIYRGVLVATAAAQNIQTATMTSSYEAQIVELEKLMATQEAKIALDLQERVNNGTMTAERAALITSLREEVAARQQQVMANAEAAAANAKAAETALATATAEKAAADAMVASAEERLAIAEATNVQSELNLAKEEMDIALMQQNTAAANLNAASKQRGIAVNQAASASTVAHATATAMEANAQNADAVSSGILATAKMTLKKANDALNASFLASPLFWIAVVIAGVTYAVYKLVTAETAHEKAVRETNEALEEQQKQLEERKSNIDKLIRTVQDQNATEFERVKAYEQLKKVAPEITKQYSRQALAAMEAADAQKMLNENMDATAYEQLKNEIKQTEEWLANFDKTLQNAVKNAGQGAGAVSTKLHEQKVEMETHLQILREQVNEIDRLNRVAADESRPIEIRIKEAEENAQVRQNILDFWDAAATKMHELSEWHINQNFDQSLANLDAYIAEVEKEMSDLQKEMQNKPITPVLELRKSEGDKILNMLYSMRDSWISSGATNIPFTLDFQIGQGLQAAQNQSDEATKKVQELQAQVDALKAAAKKVPKTKDKKKSGKSDAERKAEEAARQREKAFEFERKQEEDQAEQLQAARDAQEEARIAQISNANDRELAQMKYEHKKTLQEIDKQERDYRKKNYELAKAKWELDNKDSKKVYSDTKEGKRKYDDIALTEQQTKEITALREKENAEWERIEEERRKIESSALTEFLREYGNYQQKRLAIAREAAEKIAEAGTEGERLAARAQQKEAEKSLAFEQFKKSINWEDVFSDLDRLSVEHLDKLRDQLQKTLKEGSLSATDYKTVVEQINNIEAAIVEKQNEWKNIFGLTIPELEKRKQLEQDALEAQERADEIAKQYFEDLQKVNEAKAAIQGFGLKAGIELDAKDIKLENADEILAKFDKASPAYERAKQLFDGLQDAESGLANSTEALGSAQTEAASAAEAAGSNIAMTVAIIDQIVHKINDNVQSAAEFFDQLNLNDTAFGKGFSYFAESSKYATEAWEALKSGNFMGVLNGVYGSIRTLGNAIGAWGVSGFGESDKTLERDIERLTGSNEALKNAIDNLSEDLSNSSFSDAGAIYKEMLNNMEQSQKNTQEMMRRSAAAYNNGFAGIGGKGSSNSKINAGMTADDWRRVSKAAGTAVNSASGFWQLTSEQMAKVAKNAPDVYAKIKNYADEGYKGASEFMDSYIEYWKQLKEVQDAYNEKLTGTSLDNVESDFKSMLLDMDSDAADMADNFEKYLREAIIGALVADQFKPMLEQWYKSFAKAAETDGIDKSEQEALRKEWDAITEQGLKMRDQLRDQFDWGNTGEGSGAYKAASSFSQEQGDELNGRLASIQIGQERNNQSLILAVTTLQNLSVVVSAHGNVLSEIRNLMLTGVGHLEDIARYTKIASQYGDVIESIANKLKEL